MNERIKQIGLQAHQYADRQVMLVDAFYQKEYDKKFADLIVKECADFIDSKLEMSEYSHEVVAWADGADLKEHFGVEP